MRLIDVSTKKHPGTFAMVDDVDYEAMRAYSWHAIQRRPGHPIYVSRATVADGKKTSVLMHRQLLGCVGMVDHADGNGLNNQRTNLREATPLQNMHNRRKRTAAASRFKGVTWNKRAGKWQAQIGIDKTVKYLGLFDDEVAAAEAYDTAATAAFGAFASTNFNRKAA